MCWPRVKGPLSKGASVYVASFNIDLTTLPSIRANLTLVGYFDLSGIDVLM